MKNFLSLFRREDGRVATESHVAGEDLDFLVGLHIVDVRQDYQGALDSYLITLSDGTRFYIEENEGCGGCCSGWSKLPNLKSIIQLDHVITDVKVEYGYEDSFKIFIYYHDKVYEGQGDDGYGNGYYGGGFHLRLYATGDSFNKNK